jgi:hypothetical protein
MEQQESNEPVASTSGNDARVSVAPAVSPAANPPAPLPCPTCGVPTQLNPPSNNMTTSAYVYALGRIEPRFPRLSVEKEYVQATGRAETAGLTDRQALQTVLSQPENRYLARQLCYVLTIEGLDTYILQLGDPVDLTALIKSLRRTPRLGDGDVVVGSGTRKIVEVIFSYTNRETDVTEKFFVCVDVTEEFPFLHTKLSPYYGR